MAKKNFTFRIDEEIVQHAKDQAVESGVSMNVFVENALSGASPFQPATLQVLNDKVDRILKHLESDTSSKSD